MVYSSYSFECYLHALELFAKTLNEIWELRCCIKTVFSNNGSTVPFQLKFLRRQNETDYELHERASVEHCAIMFKKAIK